MAKKYLDDAGLTYFWGKVRTYFLGGTSPDDPADTTNCPKMDGTKTYGTSHILAREDHIHPTDTSRAPLASPAFTGNPTAPTQSTSDDSTKIATTEFVHDVIDGLSTGVTGVRGNAESSYRTGNVEITPANMTIASGTALGSGDAIVFTDSSDSNKLKKSSITFGSNDNTYLRKDGTWGTPAGTTYSDATTSASGLMSATDKTKLDSITMSNGVIDSSVLPSYVDDVIEAYPRTGQTELSQNWLSLSSGGSALTPETGKIYVLLANSTNYSTNDTFRWSGSTYVKLADGGVSSITTSEIDTIMAS